MSVNPITPNEIGGYKIEVFPEFVLKAFNDLIAQKFTGRCARVTQEDAILKIQEYSPNTIGRQTIFEQGWLNIEEIYEAAGWMVEYDKPGYNESYGAYWEFRQ